MGRLKVVAAAVLSILLLVVIFQNTESVTTRILFFSIELPRAALLLLTLLIGIVIGLLLTLFLAGRRNSD